jgi:nicotinamidase-related amidase
MAKTSFQKRHSIVSLTFPALPTAVSFFLRQGVIPASAQTIVDKWAAVQAPKPPELKPVTLDPKTTALLVLDFVKQTCNAERQPRCLTSVPEVQALLKLARDKGVSVVHSITTAATPADIAKELTPADGEPIVKAPADKFFKTDLEKILNDKGVKTVVIVGTAAQGAVLNTASQAAFRGFTSDNSSGRHVGRKHLFRAVHRDSPGKFSRRGAAGDTDQNRHDRVAA